MKKWKKKKTVSWMAKSRKTLVKTKTSKWKMKKKPWKRHKKRHHVGLRETVGPIDANSLKFYDMCNNCFDFHSSLLTKIHQRGISILTIYSIWDIWKPSNDKRKFSILVQRKDKIKTISISRFPGANLLRIQHLT